MDGLSQVCPQMIEANGINIEAEPSWTGVKCFLWVLMERTTIPEKLLHCMFQVYCSSSDEL